MVTLDTLSLVTQGSTRGPAFCLRARKAAGSQVRPGMTEDVE